MSWRLGVSLPSETLPTSTRVSVDPNDSRNPVKTQRFPLIAAPSLKSQVDPSITFPSPVPLFLRNVPSTYDLVDEREPSFRNAPPIRTRILGKPARGKSPASAEIARQIPRFGRSISSAFAA